MGIVASDTFTRANQSGFGTASDGESWAFTGSATESIASNEGVITLSGGADILAQLGSQTLADQEILCRCASITDVNTYFGITARLNRSGPTNYKWLNNVTTGQFLLNKQVNGTNTNLATYTFSIVAGTFYWLKLRCQGTTISAKIWQDGSAEPGSWAVSVTDSSIASGGWGLLSNQQNASNSNQFDNFTANSLAIVTTYPFTESLSPAESLSETDAYVPTEALTLTEIPGIATWPIDALSVSESIAYNESLVPIEAPGLAEILLNLDSYSVTDALPLTEMLLSSVPINSNPFNATDILALVESIFIAESYGPLETLSISDIGSTQISPIETLTLADSLLQTATTLPIDATSPTDAPLETVNGTFVDALTLTDSLTYTALTNNLMLSTDAPPLAESILETDSYSVTESLSLTETILIGVPTVNNQMIFEDDLIVSDLIGSMQRGFIENLALVETEINMASVFLGQAIAASSSVLIITGGLITNLLLLTQTATSTASYAGNIFTTLLATSSLSAYGQVSTFATNAVATSILANGGNSFFETDMVASTLMSPAAYTVGSFTEITALSDSMFGVRSFGPVNAPIFLESMQGTEVYIPIDQTPPTTFVSGANANLTPFTESLLAAESIFYSDAYVPSEMQGVAESIQAGDSGQWVDVLTISDSGVMSMSASAAAHYTSTIWVTRDMRTTTWITRDMVAPAWKERG